MSGDFANALDCLDFASFYWDSASLCKTWERGSIPSAGANIDKRNLLWQRGCVSSFCVSTGSCMLCAFSEPVKVMVYNLETALLVKLACVYAARALNSATRPLRKYAEKTVIPIRLETAPKVKIAL